MKTPQIDDYQIVRELGSGGMGTVYEAVHVKLSRRVAIKVVRPDQARDPEIELRFLNEARALARVTHPGIVQIYTFGVLSDGTSYLVMEFLKGESLAQRWQRAGRTRELFTELRLVQQVADVLAVLHRYGVVHRDLKPDNVMTIPDPVAPTQQRAKLVDFGLAKLIRLSGKRSESWLIMGTPAYMSPEQCRGAGQVDAKTDSYALGVMLYELFAGHPPFDSQWPGDLIGMHLYVEPPPLQQRVPGIDPRLAALTHRLLLKDKSQRPSMSEVATYLAELLVQLEKEGAVLLPAAAQSIDAMAPTSPGTSAMERPSELSDAIVVVQPEGALVAARREEPRVVPRREEPPIAAGREEALVAVQGKEPRGDAPASQADLDALFAQATSACILRGTLQGGTVRGLPALIKLDRSLLSELREALRIRPGKTLLRCECSNAYTIELRDSSGQAILLEYHPHPTRSSIGWREWRGDGELLAGFALLEFLDSQGIPLPLRNLEEDYVEEEARRIRGPWDIIPDLSEWLPQSVHAHLKEWLLGRSGPVFDEVLTVLRETVKDEIALATKLLCWLGGGAAWQVRPSGGQGAALKLLLRLKFQVVLTAAYSSSSELASRGAARFFTSPEVMTFRARQLAQVPEDLWARLIGLAAEKKDRDLHALLLHAAQLAQAPLTAPTHTLSAGVSRPQLGSPPGPLSGLVTDGTSLYSISRRVLVRYTPGHTSWSSPVYAPASLSDLASTGPQLLLTSRTDGLVYRMLSHSDEAEVLAANRREPRQPIFCGHRPYWVEELPLALAERSGLGSMRKKLVAMGAGAEPADIVPLSGRLLALVGDSSHLYYLEGDATGQAQLQSILHTQSQPRLRLTFKKYPANVGTPLLALSETHILCADGSSICGISKPGERGNFSIAASGPVAAIAVASHGIYALIGQREDKTWRVEYGATGQDRLRPLGSFPRSPDQSVSAAILGDTLYWACGDLLYSATAK